MRCGLCGFLILKLQTTLHHAVWCSAVHYYLRCGVVMPFCGWFWCGFCGLCGLCDLVNTPSNNQNHKCNVLYGNIYLDNINKKNNNYHFWSARA